MVIPFGSNLVYWDDAFSMMNRAVSSPLDFVAYAQRKPASHPERYLPMFAGDTVMKRRGGLEVVCKTRSEAAFRAEMQGALRSNATRPAEPPVSAVAAADADRSCLAGGAAAPARQRPLRPPHPRRGTGR